MNGAFLKLAKKITLLGRAGVGKTSILKLIFEGKKPKDLMISPLEPTRGITPNIYFWMDLELGIFDTSGQELPVLLEDDNEQIYAFDNTDIVVYVFDYPTWTTKPQEIIKEIHRVFNILKEGKINSNLILIFHKIDLISQKVSFNFQLMKAEIKNRINLPNNAQIYFTSLYPELVFTTFNAFTNMLSRLSPDSTNLKRITDELIKDYPKTICFVTNKNLEIIVQSITSDFNTDLIFDLSHSSAKFIKLTKQGHVIGGNFHLIDSGASIIGLLVNNIEDLYPDLKNLFILSETTKKLELLELMEIIKTEIKKYYSKKS